MILSFACVSPKAGGPRPGHPADDAGPDEVVATDTADEPLPADATAPDAPAPERPAEITGMGGTGGIEAGAPDVAPDSAPTGCSATQHRCEGSCVDNQSVDHCGTLCEKCPIPAGAMPTCDGTTCGFTCGAGQKKCAAAALCVPANGCCTATDCPIQPGGQTGSCDSGTHLCNYGCPAGTQACTAGGSTTCIAAGGCCRDSDCPGPCQTCSSGHTCAAVTGREDPNGRCPGTCDGAGACKSKRGQTCTTTSGGCVAGSTCSPDGYCCDQACSAPCMACDLPGALGTCTPVTGPPHGGRPACAGAGSSCAGSCAGKADGSCAYPVSACGSPSCLVDGQGNATLTPAGTCDGNGQCTPGAPHACPGGLTCASASACKTSCSGSGDCTAGSYCAGVTCATRKATGLACGAPSECATGACVDGVCCGTACPLATAGMCMGCSTAATGLPNGTCAPRNGSSTRACPALSPTACVNTQTDASNCNGCGNACSAGGLPSGTVPACLFGTCDAACATAGSHLCRDTSGIRTCVSTIYGFEGGDDSNWVSSDDALSAPSMTRSHSGSYSYAVWSPNGGSFPIYAVPFLCNTIPFNTGMDVRGRKVSVWIYIESSTAGFPNTKCYLDGSSPLGAKATMVSPPGGQWFQLIGTFSDTDTRGDIYVHCNLPPEWKGDTSRWYIDDFRID